jgi:hypothetical protein
LICATPKVSIMSVRCKHSFLRAGPVLERTGTCPMRPDALPASAGRQKPTSSH